MTRPRKLGEVLLAAGLIREPQLAAALGEQARLGLRLGETLVRLGFVGERELVRALCRRFELPGIDLEGKRVAPEVLARVPVELAERRACLPLFVQHEKGEEVLYLGMDDPTDLAALDEVGARAGLPTRPVVAGPLQLRRAIARHYRGAEVSAGPAAEDTAPLLPEPLAGARDGGGAAASRTAAHETGGASDPAPRAAAAVSPGDAAGDGPAGGEEGRGGAARAHPPEEPPRPLRPRHVATRDILRALVHLLIEREVITREELLHAVQSVLEDGASPRGAR